MFRLPKAVFSAAVILLSACGGDGGGGGTETTNPTPGISSLAPSQVQQGAAATPIRVMGSDFVPSSVIRFRGVDRPTEFVGNGELRATLTVADLASAGPAEIVVFNPAPGGGVSNVAQLDIAAAQNPAPAVASLFPESIPAGSAAVQLRVNGTGFMPTSVVRVDGTPVPTTFVSTMALEATLGEAVLRQPGTRQITVVNPGPGGGTSAAVTLSVSTAGPVMTLLPSQGASAGRPGFTLYVHGRGFAETSVVRWNGSTRPTQFLSATRLAATINSDDVAAPGTAQITVHTPAPGGGTSAAVPFAVRTVGAPTVTSSRTVPISARDVIHDPVTGRLYAAVSGTSPAHANTVAEIDPVTGTVVRSVFVGSQPGRIARSDDGQFLYVGIDGASAVRRVTLATLAPGLQWSLNGGEVAGDLEVMPNNPRTVAVSRQRPGYSPPLEGVTIYDDGQARSQSSPGHTGGNRIEFLESASVLYGYNNAHTGFEFFTMGIDEAGIRHSATTGGVIAGFYTDILGKAGRIYGTNGSVVDAERRVRIGTIGGGTAVAVEPLLGRAFVLTQSAINVYDLNTFQLLGSVPVTGLSLDHPALVVSRLVRWGDDGLAFFDDDQVFLLRSPLFGG